MKGFRDFILRGNLVELAVAFIIGAAFATVIAAFTKLVLEAIGKITGGKGFNFDSWQPGGWSTVGPFLTALIAFLIMAFVVYFFIVKPYERAKDRFFPAEPDADTISCARSATSCASPAADRVGHQRNGEKGWSRCPQDAVKWPGACTCRSDVALALVGPRSIRSTRGRGSSRQGRAFGCFAGRRPAPAAPSGWPCTRGIEAFLEGDAKVPHCPVAVALDRCRDD